MLSRIIKSQLFDHTLTKIISHKINRMKGSSATIIKLVESNSWPDVENDCVKNKASPLNILNNPTETQVAWLAPNSSIDRNCTTVQYNTLNLYLSDRQFL